MDELEIRKRVRERYGREVDACCGASEGPCCEDGPVQGGAAESADAAGIPRLGVGDPIERLAPKAGETILDLGSGPGRDVLVAAERVGPKGRALGVDATPEMVFRARKAAAALGRANAEFRLGEIEHLPVEGGSVDGVSSDCVLNLSPDKAQVFREAFRVLKPGGRFVLSDIVREPRSADGSAADLEDWARCEAGAVALSEYESLLRAAGFVALESESLGTYRDGKLSRAVLIARKPDPGSTQGKPATPSNTGPPSGKAAHRRSPHGRRSPARERHERRGPR